MKSEKADKKKVINNIAVRFLYPSAIYFSLIVFLFSLLCKILDLTSSLSVSSLLGIAGLSLCFGGCNQIFYVKSIPGAVRVIIHWAAFLGLYLIFTTVIAGLGEQIITALILTLPITVVYFAFFGLKALIKLLCPQSVINGFLYPLGAYFFIGVVFNEILCYSIEVSYSAPTFENLCYLWIFALVLAGARNIFRAKMSVFFKLLIHFLISMLDIIVVLFVLMHNYLDYSDAFMPCIIIGVIYIFVSALIVFIKSRKDRAENLEQKYKRQFS